jgi:hypothetical protein
VVSSPTRSAADQVILTDVCGFHEQPIPGPRAGCRNAVLDAHPDQAVVLSYRAELVDLVPAYARSGDLVTPVAAAHHHVADELSRPKPRGRADGDRRRRAGRAGRHASRCRGGSARRAIAGFTTHRAGGRPRGVGATPG